MKMKKFIAWLLFIAAIVLLTGCGTAYPTRVEYEYPSDRYSHYDDSGYRRSCYNCGIVKEVYQVKSRDKHLGAGTAIGAIAGGALGSTVGKGNGRDAATIAGALIGGTVGHNAEKNTAMRATLGVFV